MIPKYLSLQNQIKEDIISKKYPLFSKLPTEVSLSEEYHVSRATVRQALSLLEEEGIIEKRWGSGNVVVSAGLSSNKETVALILPDDNEYRYREIKEDCLSLLYKEKLKLKVFNTNNNLNKEREYLEDILRNTYAGIIVEPVKSALPSINQDFYQQILRRRIPMVFLHSTILPNQPVLSAVADNYNAGYQLARHLINKGHKNIGAILKADDSVGLKRYQGFSEALRDSNIPICEEHIYWYTSNDIQGKNAFSFIKNLKISPKELTGMVCYNDQIAFHLIEHLQSLNLLVPNDIAVIGIDDDYYAQASTPGITTLSLTRAIGKEATDLLISSINNKARESVTIPWHLITREST